MSEAGVSDMTIARIHEEANGLDNVERAVRSALEESGIAAKDGARIAVAVGSRGIASIAEVVHTAVAWLQEHGAKPFIVPAMGSHGGATAEGQRAVLRSYGVDEDSMGVPVLSSMETVQIEADDLDVPVYMDRNAWESDGVLLVNRVKPHTDFQGFPESGLVKMSVIGLGKHDQAKAIHGRGIHGLTKQILPVARKVFSTGRIIGGLAIVENALDRPLEIRAAAAEAIEPMERELLELARKSMARLPLDDIDLLIVDELGKDVSGTGMDTNVIGRIRIQGQPEPSTPRVKSILVTRLTAASHGNAIGVGLADVITRELYDAINFAATYENGVTSSFGERIKIPYVASDHRDALAVGLRFTGLHADAARALAAARIVRVRNTLELSTLMLSPAAAEAVRGNTRVEVSEKYCPLIGADGRFTDWPE